MIAVRRDRLTNVRPGRRVSEPCPSCCGQGALLALPNGQAVAATYVVPDRRRWHRHPVAPCPTCEGTGIELLRRPRRWGEG